MKKFMAVSVLLIAFLITAGLGATKAEAGYIKEAKQTACTVNSISIQWTPYLYSGDTNLGYTIEEKEVYGNDDWHQVASLTSGSSMYTLTGLKPGTKYSIRVTLNYKSSTGRVNTSPGTVKNGDTYYAATALTTVSGLKQIKWWYYALDLGVGWNKQTAADGYEVECYKSNGKLHQRVEAGSYSDSAKITKIKNEMIYTVRVRAYQKVNGAKKYTGWCAPIYCFTQPRITALKVSGGKLTVKWKKVSGATGYRIYVSTKPLKGYKKVKQVSARKSSFTIKKFKGKKFKSNKAYYVYIQTLKKVNGKVNTSGRLYYWNTKKSAGSFGYFN